MPLPWHNFSKKNILHASYTIQLVSRMVSNLAVWWYQKNHKSLVENKASRFHSESEKFFIPILQACKVSLKQWWTFLWKQNPLQNSSTHLGSVLVLRQGGFWILLQKAKWGMLCLWKNSRFLKEKMLWNLQKHDFKESLEDKAWIMLMGNSEFTIQCEAELMLVCFITLRCGSWEVTNCMLSLVHVLRTVWKLRPE